MQLGACVGLSVLGAALACGGKTAENRNDRQDAAGGTGSFGGPQDLGRGCGSDSECGAGLECWQHDPSNAGPSGGLCTRSCANGGNAACQAIDAASRCVTIAHGSFCMPGCSPGGLPNLDPANCRGRQDMACGPADSGGYVCTPSCNWDGNCGDASSCVGTTGLCRQGGSAKMPIGASCSDDCLDNVCAEFAATGGLRTRMCTAPCTIGSLPSCEWEGPSSGRAESFCLFSATLETVSAGDLGYCGQLCDCNDDCVNPDFVCISAGSSTLLQATGRKGYCHFSSGGSGIPLCG